MSDTLSMPEFTVLLDRLASIESPRWHEGWLWFAHWGTDEIVAVAPGQSHLIFGTGSTGFVTTIRLLKICLANALYKPLKNLDAIALAVDLDGHSEVVRYGRGEIILEKGDIFSSRKKEMP